MPRWTRLGWLRAGRALRKAAGALARRPRPARDGGGEAAGTPPPGGEGDVAFLRQVQETLLQISTGPAGAPSGSGASVRSRLRAWLRGLAALRETVRRHEDAVLALALLAGIAAMFFHWAR